MKKIYLLPNLITTANLVCGFLGMMAAFQGDYARACWYIIIAGICDLLDGRIARLAKATSSFGVQYDSLADLTSFGIAPAAIMFSFALKDLTRFGISVAAVYCVCAALRLARFNVGAEEKETEKNPSAIRKMRKGYFQGLPSPVSAGTVVVTILAQSELGLISESLVSTFMAILGFTLSVFMISSIPFPSFKEVNWRSRGGAWMLLIPIVAILFVIQAPAITMLIMAYAYLILGFSWAAYIYFVRDKKQGVKGALQEY